MGGCVSRGTEHKTDSRIGKALESSKSQEGSTVKLLLLGTGESGKTTIFKQARTLYGRGYNERERTAFRTPIYQNIILQMQAVIRFRAHSNIDLQYPENSEHEETIKSLGRARKLKKLEPFHFNALRSVWKDNAIQKSWSEKSRYQVFDCLDYFLNEENLKRIEAAGKNYVPTLDDTLHVRYRTAGIVVEKLKMRNILLELYDVGGQRTERRKWIDCFNDVTTIIFVAAINEFDQTLFEAPDQNRLEEALNVWDDIVNRTEFEDTNFIFFLNKWDLFVKKVRVTPYKLAGVRNDDYEGKDPRDFTENSKEQFAAIEECLEHTKQRFESLISNRAANRSIVFFPTTATDGRNMNKVFATVQSNLLDSLIESSL